MVKDREGPRCGPGADMPRTQGGLERLETASAPLFCQMCTSGQLVHRAGWPGRRVALTDLDNLREGRPWDARHLGTRLPVGETQGPQLGPLLQESLENLRRPLPPTP